MSVISISANSVQSMALEGQANSIETGSAGIGLESRMLDKPEHISPEQGETAGQITARTNEFFAMGDQNSMGADNAQQTAQTAFLETGLGSIADAIA